MTTHLTLHVVSVLPWSNLNRDDSGLPKRLRQGGVQRGMLSSQSIKRAARTDYELKSGDLSVRSSNLAPLVAARALELAPDGDLKAFEKEAKKRIGNLTKGDKGSGADGAEAGRSTWLSSEELEIAAQSIAAGSDSEEFISEGQSGALAIAAFGRMFANQQNYNTEAALSVSPAVSTHATVIETDYFSTAEERPTQDQGAGATYLGVANYLNGVFYRTVTIDRAQLKLSWSGFGSEDAAERLKAMVTSLIYKLPRGKEHGTAPYTIPALVLAEEQSYRVAYDFETPVSAADAGGYLAATIDRLHAERQAALRFDAANFGATTAVAGSAEGLEKFGVEVTDRQGISDLVANWILQ